jgi:hypothetical protein
MLIERGMEGQIVSREVRKQWRERKKNNTQMERSGDRGGSERKQRREEKAKRGRDSQKKG